MGYKTPQLHDEGEEGWELKLHVECDRIYLEGYKNIAPAGFHPYQRPALVEANITDVENYWARFGKDTPRMKITLDPDQIAVDVLSDMRCLPYVGAADKILCLESFAGLTLTDAHKTLLNWWNVLKVRGVLVFSVPDPAETQKLLEVWPELNAYGLRHAFYTEENILNLLRSHGFDKIEQLEGVHSYPSIVLRAVKADPFVPGRAYQRLPEIEEGWKVLDVGPGDFPLPRATEFLDQNDEKAERLGGKPLHVVNLDEDLPFDDDSYDFVYCSHVLEHLESPKKGLKELQRIGKRGYVEIPSVCIDFLMKFGKTHPKWLCWDSGGILLFIEKSKEQNKLFLDWENVWGAFFHHAVHGTNLDPVQAAIRAYFWQNQHILNIMAFWDKKRGNFPIRAVEIRLKVKSE